jgi:hypothetical protein
VLLALPEDGRSGGEGRNGVRDGRGQVLIVQ